MFKKFFTQHMALIGSLGQLLFYFQGFTIFWGKDASGVSLLGFSVALVSLSCWLAYGLSIKDKPLIIANITGIIGAFFVLCGVLMYGL
ncbi:MAG: hypothetical protein JSR85_04905 [Proteobacteria bacterium]|nr:hypothetical protein [Pseudomonadota bacterium]